MRKKSSFILAWVLVFTLTGLATANNWWDGGGDGVSWTDISNWQDESGTIPTSADYVWIEWLPGGAVNIEIVDSQEVNYLYMGNAWDYQGVGQYQLAITSSGSLTTSGNVTIHAKESYVGASARLNVDGILNV